MKRIGWTIGLCLFAIQSWAGSSDPRVTGDWVFTNGPDYPGLRMMQIHRENSQWVGTLTTDWYGPMPMRNLTIQDGVASFDIHNGNPRVPVKRWTAELDGADLRIHGSIWYANVDQRGRRGTRAEIAARVFTLAPLPKAAKVPVDGLAQSPPMGWSSWNKFQDKIDDATIRGIADAMVSSGLRDAGYVFVNIDDGWQGTRDAAGVLHGNERFPDMKALANYVHARGLKLGLYSSPGPKTCAGYTGSYGHVESDAKTFASWGIDYLKYDLCSGEGFYLTRDDIQRAYQQMGAALKATGRPIVFSLCEYGREDVGSWGRDVGGHLWRTTGDITDEYAVMTKIGFERNGNPANASPGGWNDPDMLEVGNGGMSLDEYRTHLSLWALAAAPLLMGHDVRAMSKDTQSLLENREIIAIDQDALGIQGHAVRKDGMTEIWSKRLADGSVAIGLFNRDSTAHEMALTLADTGLANLRRARDLWKGEDLQALPKSFLVAPHGVVLLRVFSANAPL